MSTTYATKAARRTLGSSPLSRMKNTLATNHSLAWVKLKYSSNSPSIYPSMISEVATSASAGSIVSIHTYDGHFFGFGLYDPKARVPVRVYKYGNMLKLYENNDQSILDNEYFVSLLNSAIDYRLITLRLQEHTNAFRVINSDGDQLSGLTIDKYNDVLSVEVYSYGMCMLLDLFLPILHKRLGTKYEVVRTEIKGTQPSPQYLKRFKNTFSGAVQVNEYGILYSVDFNTGHKTGFFCDQRENRWQLSKMVQNCRVLDLCCYTGGFALNAARGGASSVTAVDLDEKVILQATINANRNGNNERISWIHADAFSYARQAQRDNSMYDVVILDPPKFIFSKSDETGYKKYEDLNRLGLSLVQKGGLFVTCSCSGMLSAPEFERIVISAAHKQNRYLQFLQFSKELP